MRVILNAVGYRQDLYPILLSTPSPLMRVFDCSILTHIIQLLRHMGVDSLDIILSHHPNRIEEEIGDGSQWGMRINTHLVRKPIYVTRTLRYLAMSSDQTRFLLGYADLLPAFQLSQFENYSDSQAQLLYDSEGVWWGWGLFSREVLCEIPKELDYEKLPLIIGSHKKVTVSGLLSARTFPELLESNRRCLNNHGDELLLKKGHEQSSGIWLGKETSIHSSAQLLPPVFIGDGVEIEEGAKIGPYAIIENHCVIDCNSVVEHSMVFENSYVGIGLELRNMVVSQHTVYNMTLGSHIRVKDSFVLSKIAKFSVKEFIKTVFERSFALVSLIALSPIILPIALIKGISSTTCLRFPIQSNGELHEEFSLYSLNLESEWMGIKSLPCLWNIVKGDMRLTGITPMDHTAFDELSEDWKEILSRGEVGWLRLSSVEPPIDEMGAVLSDLYYVTNKSFTFDCRLILRWLWVKLIPFGTPKSPLAQFGVGTSLKNENAKGIFPQEQLGCADAHRKNSPHQRPT
ncbi:MAG: sugar transferase [Chlamydiia bacterium]|nr:sugar transferase [Chlamydiia bacterium]